MTGAAPLPLGRLDVRLVVEAGGALAVCWLEYGSLGWDCWEEYCRVCGDAAGEREVIVAD